MYDVDKSIFKVKSDVTLNVSIVGYETEVFIFSAAAVLSSWLLNLTLNLAGIKVLFLPLPSCL